MADITIDPFAMQELGQTGLVRFSGFVFEEFLRELQGPKGMAVYREMGDNDPTVGGSLFAYDQLIRKVQWRVDPCGEQPEDQQRADFTQECMGDMSATWIDTISEAFSMVRYGFSWHEIVYKHRLGCSPGADMDGKPLPTSKYDDGLIGWRRLPIRAQETLWQWEFEDSGSIKAMIQRAAPHFNTVSIPLAKSLLFRHRAYKNNPEGMSALRSAYRPWYFKKKMEVIEAIGVERDLAGLPVAEVPPELLASNATSDQKALFAKIQKIVRDIRRDEQAGIVWPLAYDSEGKNPLYRLSLMSSGGKRQIDTNAIIGRYNEAIAQSILTDLILIGGSGRGSYALMEAKVDLFTQAMEGWLDSITEVFNRHAIPRLFQANGMPLDNLPILAHGPVDTLDLVDLSAYIQSLSAAGMLTPNPADEGFLRQMAHMPATPDDEGNMAVGKSAKIPRRMLRRWR